ncbi:MAG: hypothetical protein Q7K40_01785 [bacterium]|nr:hypothetical protein [bacterium]
MTRNNIIISVATLLLAIILGGGYWYVTKTPAGKALFESFPGESTVREGGATAGGEPTPTPDDATPVDIPPNTSSALPRLYELHKAPVAGVGFAETKDKKGFIMSISARYIERGLGHIYETPFSTYTESRIVNETRLSIAEAAWGNNGKSAVVRFIDDKEGGVIKTRIINIGAPSISFARGTSTESVANDFLKTEEVYLPDYIPFLALAQDGADKLFYLGGGDGFTTNFKDTSFSKVFSSTFTEWLPQFPNQKLITLTTKPSEKVFGYLFFLNPSTKSVTKVLGGINGLTTLTSPDGKLVLYSEIKSGSPELSLYDTVKKETRQLYVQTLPEKCVWGIKKTTVVYCAVPQTLPRASYPDQWYQGLVSFSDDLWEVDAKTFIARRMVETKTLGAPALDMTNLSLSSDDAYLLFMNKASGTPWVYSVIPPVPQRLVENSQAVAPIATPTSVPPSVITSDMQKLR